MPGLSTPQNTGKDLGADYVIGIGGAEYFCPSRTHVEAKVKALTDRIRRWTQSETHPDLVETFTEDRNRLLDRWAYLSLMAETAKEPA